MRKGKKKPTTKPERTVYVNKTTIDVWLKNGELVDAENKVYAYDRVSGKYYRKGDFVQTAIVTHGKPVLGKFLTKDGVEYQWQLGDNGELVLNPIFVKVADYISLSPEKRSGFSEGASRPK